MGAQTPWAKSTTGSTLPYPPRVTPDGPPATLSKEDENHLDLLGVLYWVYGGIIALGGATFGLFAILPAILVSSAPAPRGGHPAGPPPWVIGGVFALLFGFVALLLVVKGITMIVVGFALRRRQGYMLCMIGAAMAVMNIPLGTALAIFTFIILNKPEAKKRFGYG